MTTLWPREVRDFVLVTLYVALTGPVVGLIWAAASPKTDLLKALTSSGVAWKAEAGADAYFFLIGLAAGVVCAGIALACRRDGPGALAGLAGGGVAAAFVADRVGYLLNRSDTLDVLRANSISLSRLAEFGIDPFFKVRALGVIMAWPIAALVVHASAVGLRDPYRSLP